MAATLAPRIQAFKAGADLSTHKYKMVKYGADLQTIVLAGAGEKAIGVLQNDPGLGQIAEVCVYGGCPVKINSVVALGASIGAGAAGVGILAGAGVYALGQTQEAGVAGDVIAMVVDRHTATA